MLMRSQMRIQMRIYIFATFSSFLNCFFSSISVKNNNFVLFYTTRRPKNADLVSDLIADSNVDPYVDEKCQQKILKLKQINTGSYGHFLGAHYIKLGFFPISADPKAM